MSQPIAIEMTHQQWIDEAMRRFGPDHMKWRFVCPSCSHVASVADWHELGAPEGEIAFSCVGRRMKASDSKTFRRAGGPCLYAGGGLFKLNPIHVFMPDGVVREAFAFAELAPVQQYRR